MLSYFRINRWGSLLILLILAICSGRPDALAASENTTPMASGLLLGLALDREALTELKTMERIPDGLRTLWLCKQGDQIYVLEKRDAIIVPGGDDFWVVENQSFKMSKFRDETPKTGSIFNDYESYYYCSNLVSYPAGQGAVALYTPERFREKERIDDETIMGRAFITEVEWPHYFGNQYAAIMEYYFCTGGGSYRSVYNGIRIKLVTNLGDFNKRENYLELFNLLSDKAKARLKAEVKKYYKVISADKNFREIEQADLENLGLKHINGHWQVQLPICREYINQGNGSSGSYTKEFITVPVELPYRITSHDRLGLDWEVIKAKVPGARDAVSSPDGSLLVVLAGDRVQIFLNPGPDLGKPVLSLMVDKLESIVSNQWATGEYVAKWDKRMKTLMK